MGEELLSGGEDGEGPHFNGSPPEAAGWAASACDRVSHPARSGLWSFVKNLIILKERPEWRPILPANPVHRTTAAQGGNPMIHRFAPLAVALVLSGIAAPAFAQQAGEWTFGIGAHQVNPKSDNSSVAGGTFDVEVGSNVRPTITAEYFVRDNLGIEVLASLPFQHDIHLVGLGKVGSTKHLPPTVSVQYHFGQGTVKPFVGLGVNYTRFSSTSSSGALAGSDLELNNSYGLAAHAGIDFEVSQNGSIRIDARWIDIDTDATLNGADIGTVNIDPLVYGAAYVFKF
jgi:outer membrane protein